LLLRLRRSHWRRYDHEGSSVALSTWPFDVTILSGLAIPGVIRMHRKRKSIVSGGATGAVLQREPSNAAASPW
jgi:hypothetical protein